MILPAIALFLLLAQNAGPQQPAAPASIEGVAIKAGTGESLSKVTVTLIEVRSGTPGNIALQERGVNPYADSPPLIVTTTLIPAPLSRASRETVTTLADGKFQFENLRPGNYQLTATSPGYAPMELGQRGPNGRGTTFTLKAGQKMQNLALTLIPEGSITGRVVDSNGEPLRRALVQAHKVVYQERGRSLQTIQAVPTDDRGDFRLFWLPPGKYYVSATPTDENARTMPVMTGGAGSSTTPLALAALNGLVSPAAIILRDTGTLPVAGLVPGIKITSSTLPNGEVIEEGTVPVYYPSAFDLSKATPVEVRSGNITGGVNITASAARVFRIRGMMVDNATGKPLSSSNINLVTRNGPLISLAVAVQQTPNVSGFEISGVVPGSYILYGTVGNANGQPGVGVSMVDVSSTNVDNIVVPASSPMVINGRVVIEGALANPNPNAGARSLISIRFENQTLGMPAINVNVAVEQDGKFTVVVPYPGDYRILVTGGSGLVPKSILYDGRDVQTEGIHIDGATAGSLEIVLTNKGGRIEGNVVADRQRVANATVVLMPTYALRQQTNLYQTVQTNADGHYAIASIAPGAYKLFAWDDVPDRAWFDAEFMRDFESQGREITIRESAMETLDLPVIPR